MKRTLNPDEAPAPQIEERMKKKKNKIEGSEEDHEEQMVVDHENHELGLSNLGDDLLFELFKHFDARSLGVATCVDKRWSKMVKDERLWEMICTKHWAKVGYGNQQLRSVVTALGGFRRLHSLYIWPLMRVPSSSSASSTTTQVLPSRKMMMMTPTPKWGKDEVHLSLSLLSTSRYYEMLSSSNNNNNRGSR